MDWSLLVLFQGKGKTKVKSIFQERLAEWENV